MIHGILGGMLWAGETIVLGIALLQIPLFSSGAGIFLAPFISTFIHDFISAIYMLLINGVKKNYKEIRSLFKTRDFKYLVIASAVGGPIGMTGYVVAVNYAGAQMGAVASAVYPAIGSVLAFIFLKEKIKWYQWIFLTMTLVGVFGLSYSPSSEVNNIYIGILGGFMCAFGWGLEGVILSKCFKNDSVKSEQALLVRQSVSAIIYGIIIIPALKGVGCTMELFKAENISGLWIIALAAFFATTSYLCYYKAISKLGASKAMSLNITYTAWTIIFGMIFMKNYDILKGMSFLWCIVVVVCGVMTSVNLDRPSQAQKLSKNEDN